MDIESTTVIDPWSKGLPSFKTMNGPVFIMRSGSRFCSVKHKRPVDYAFTFSILMAKWTKWYVVLKKTTACRRRDKRQHFCCIDLYQTALVSISFLFFHHQRGSNNLLPLRLGIFPLTRNFRLYGCFFRFDSITLPHYCLSKKLTNKIVHHRDFSLISLANECIDSNPCMLIIISPYCYRISVCLSVCDSFKQCLYYLQTH